MVICQERGADLHMAQLMPLPLAVSCISKIQIGFTSLVPADPGCPGKRAAKRVCVCVCVCVYAVNWTLVDATVKAVASLRAPDTRASRPWRRSRVGRIRSVDGTAGDSELPTALRLAAASLVRPIRRPVPTSYGHLPPLPGNGRLATRRRQVARAKPGKVTVGLAMRHGLCSGCPATVS